jgi:hypothetical protein
MHRLIKAAAGVAAVVGIVGVTPAMGARLQIPNRMPSAVDLNIRQQTVKLPLYRGVVRGHRVWFILTDTSNLREAVRLGINWAPKLRNALGTRAVEHAALVHGRRLGRHSLTRFPGTVDFSGTRVVLPGPNLFPVLPGTHAGPIADRHYSPLFTFGNGVVYDGAQVANATGHNAKVLALEPRRRLVTVRLTQGRYLDRKVLYLSTESSDTVVAALENATFAPNLGAAPKVGSDSRSRSAREAIIPIVNGPRGVYNPQRQGLRSAVAGEGDPLNIIREEPECSQPRVPANCSALQYSPLWDIHPVEWTQAAIRKGLRHRVGSHETVQRLVEQGLMVNFNPDGPLNDDPEIHSLRALGVDVNCPPIFVAP